MLLLTTIAGKLRNILGRTSARETGPSYEESYQAEVNEAIAKGFPVPPRARDLPSCF